MKLKLGLFFLSTGVVTYMCGYYLLKKELKELNKNTIFKNILTPYVQTSLNMFSSGPIFILIGIYSLIGTKYYILFFILSTLFILAHYKIQSFLLFRIEKFDKLLVYLNIAIYIFLELILFFKQII